MNYLTNSLSHHLEFFILLDELVSLSSLWLNLLLFLVVQNGSSDGGSTDGKDTVAVVAGIAGAFVDGGKANSGVANVIVAHISSLVDNIIGTVEPVLNFFDVFSGLGVDGVLDFSDLAVELIADLALGFSGLLLQVGDHVVKDALHVGSSLLNVILSHLRGLLVLLVHEVSPGGLLVAEPLVNDIDVKAPLDDGFSEFLASLFHGLLEGGGLFFVVLVAVVVVVVIVGLKVLVSALHRPDVIESSHG